MYIIIPSLVILLSISGIAVIVLRKRSYLNKIYALNSAGNGSNGNGSQFKLSAFGAELFPEVKSLFDTIKISEYKTIWLMEAEKILRRTRLVSLRVDRLSDSLIKKIRRVHANGKINRDSGAEAVSTLEDYKTVPEPAVFQTISPVFLKNEEEKLIIEIAKNPKNGKLYESLGDLYMEMEGWIDAKESYEAAIELDPQNESLKIKLSSSLEKLNTQAGV